MVNWKTAGRYLIIGICAIIGADGITRVPYLSPIFKYWYLEIGIMVVGFWYAVEKLK